MTKQQVSKCARCGARFERAQRGRPRLYCSDRCRVAHNRAERALATKPKDDADAFLALATKLRRMIEAAERDHGALSATGWDEVALVAAVESFAEAIHPTRLPLT